MSSESVREESKGGMRMRPATPIMCTIMSIFVGIGLVGFLVPSAMADDTLVRFNGGIGVIPVSSGVGTGATATEVNRNIVRGVQPAGQVWTIRNLDAKIKTNGDIDVKGEGLVLAGGSNVGRATGQLVFASLFCGSTEYRSDFENGVMLAPNGNFRIGDVLTDASGDPLALTSCDSPVLLIRSTAPPNMNWFAAGILAGN
jgi:hypothetical protein